MWPRRKKEERIAYKREESVKKNFLPLAYANVEGDRDLNVVGTSLDRTRVIVLSRKKEKYKEIVNIPVTMEVSYIIPVDINRDGEIEYILIGEIDKQYTISMADRNGRETYLGISHTMPFLFSSGDLSPSLFVQEENSSYSITVSENIPVKREMKENFSILRDKHTSAFVDVNGDGIADLLLDVEVNGKRYLEIWINNGDLFSYLQRLSIPQDAGPLVFGDFLGNGAADILYFSNANGMSVNVLSNRQMPFCSYKGLSNCRLLSEIMKVPKTYGYHETELIKYPVDIPNRRFVLFKENSPLFPSVLDVNNNTFPDVLGLSVDEVTGEEYPVLLMNQEGKGFLPESKAFTAEKEVLSISFIVGANGLSDILIATEKGELKVLKSDLDCFGYYLGLATVYGGAKGKYSSPVVGTSYMCRVVETGRVVAGFYAPQSGYAPMQSPVALVGLGRTNVFVGAVYTRVPTTEYSLSKAVDKIIPNSELLMKVNNGYIRSTLHLDTSMYWPVFIPIILSLFMIFGLVSLYFTYKEKKKERKAVHSSRRYNINFDAL
ncbi:integrin alpha FG-GAP repeat containing protein 1 [Nematocida sp. LUAm3]|nr:integrin alpha FG-GAP repeat containing protein 1 [Nematocida sp. LUAm3]KAI5173656.1 integrin alpha FG-GAP repeat containing protein 1 [Nematocida sp. LUAm2]KAI5176877.1 integrin alpha FG-GAP repeat containing protein 1 [Nematocida sp. LUAm1]